MPNLEGKADFADTARVEYLSDRRDVDRFAESAAAWFAANPKGWTFSNGKIDPQLLAIRWGLHDRAVFVCRIDDNFRPIIYADLVPELPEGEPPGAVCDCGKPASVKETSRRWPCGAAKSHG